MGDEYCQKLEITNIPSLHGGGNSCGKVGIITIVIATDARAGAEPSTTTSVDGDVPVVVELYVRGAVPASEAPVPPLQVQVEVLVQHDGSGVLVCPSLCLEHPREMKSARRDHTSSVKKFATEGVQVFPQGSFSLQP